MTNSIQESQLKDIILKYYDLGELADYEQLDLGYVNESYIIEIECNGKKKKYFIRKYKLGIKEEEEIIFEHSIVSHLIKKNFHFVARVVPTKSGKTYIKESERGENIFYTIFDFLTGNDRYTWGNPTCSAGELRAAAVVLAQFHNTIYDLDPIGKRYEPKIINFLPEIAQTVEECAQKAGKTVFDPYLLESINIIQETIQRVRGVMEKDEYKELIQLVIHCDYHPGNLKFQNDKVTGLFDFDWSKMDARCFDVALALMYFCTAWKGECDGNLQLNQVAIFLSAYQQTLQNSDGLEPMNDVELDYLPDMISASILYILNWAITDFYAKKANASEYLIYLQHTVRSIQWLDKMHNREKLQQIIRKHA